MMQKAVLGSQSSNEMAVYKGRIEIEAAAEELMKPTGSWFLIDPRRSKNLGYWDVTTSVALLYVALVTPYEVALLEPALDALFFCNRLVDCVFAVDIVVQFIVMKERQNVQASLGAVWITDRKELARDYLTSWFALDVGTVGLSALDIYTVVIGTANADVLESLSTLKVLRVLRLFKLVRLFRSSMIFKRWETRIAIDYSILSMIKCFVIVLVSSHWVACAWLMQAFLGDTASSWLYETGYCAEDPEGSTSHRCQSAFSMYSASQYWAMMTITSVGYGDIAATFNNPVEMWVCSFLMLFTSLIWAQVIGTFCGVIATFNPEQNAFQAKMDQLNRFMKREAIPSEMRQRLREYFFQSKHLRLAEMQQSLVEEMAPNLKREVLWRTNKAWLQRIWFLQEAPRSFMIELAMKLRAKVFCPGDSPARGYMYIVHRGIALYQARLITKGNVFGEDIILSSRHLRSTAQARAMNYLETYFTSRPTLLELAERYPTTASKIRRFAVMLALRREILSIAKAALGLQTDDMIAKAVRVQQLAKALPDVYVAGTAASHDESRFLSKQIDWQQVKANALSAQADVEEQPVEADDHLDSQPIGDRSVAKGDYSLDGRFRDDRLRSPGGVERLDGLSPGNSMQPIGGRSPPRTESSPSPGGGFNVGWARGWGLSTGKDSSSHGQGSNNFITGETVEDHTMKRENEKRIQDLSVKMDMILQGQKAMRVEISEQRDALRVLSHWVMCDRTVLTSKLQA